VLSGLCKMSPSLPRLPLQLFPPRGLAAPETRFRGDRPDSFCFSFSRLSCPSPRMVLAGLSCSGLLIGLFLLGTLVIFCPGPVVFFFFSTWGRIFFLSSCCESQLRPRRFPPLRFSSTPLDGLPRPSLFPYRNGKRAVGLFCALAPL